MDDGVRMSDIASKLGISTVTVSRALAGKGGVSEQLKEQIRAVADEMGYHRKGKPSSAHTFTIGIVMEEHYLKPDHSFFWALYLNLIETLKEESYYSFLEIVKPAQGAKPALLPDFVLQRKVDGLVIIGAMDEAYLRRLEEAGLPIVLLDFYCETICASAILPDSYLGAYDITNHLIRMGHTKIGYVGSVEVNHNAQDRYYGYCKALDQHGLEKRGDWVIPNREEFGFKETYALPPELPTAFVCDCDQSAYHFVRDITRKGYRVPEDISVTGFYDHVFSSLMTPQLTTYRIPMSDMSRAAVDALLMWLQQEGERPRRRVVSGYMVYRDSVQDLR